MNNTKIEWCNGTWNPVTGCLHGCRYCYAERITKRFSGDTRLVKGSADYEMNGSMYIIDKPINDGKRNLPYPFGFAPTYHKYRLKKLADEFKNGANIFVCSMSDLFGDWVPDSVIEEIFAVCKSLPQHNYLFLTKNPKRYNMLAACGKLPALPNFWYGSTADTSSREIFISEDGTYNTYVSIEPMLERFPMPWESDYYALCQTDWIILGAETGMSKNKIIPDKTWIDEIVHEAIIRNIPVFMKDSLIPIMNEDMLRDMPSKLREHQVTQAYKDRFYNHCKFCGDEHPMKEMSAILVRHKRGESAHNWFYLCRNCFGIADRIVNSEACMKFNRRKDEHK